MKKWYNVINTKGADKASILIYDIIGGGFFTDGTTAKDFANTLLELEKEYPNIDIRINSPGGSVFEGLGIVNAILNSKSNIETYIDGIAYSMAAIIALSGKKVHIAKNGRLMIHNASSRIQGNAQELRIEADNLDGYDASLAITVSTITGLSENEVKTKYFNFKDNYFNATQAIDQKLVHEVIPVNAEGVDNLVKLNEYKDVLAHYKTLDPAAFKMPEIENTPIPKSQNEDDMKYIALAALVALFKEGKTPTNEQIAAAQSELTEANSGLVIITAAENKGFNDIKLKFDALNTSAASIIALFANGTDEKFNLLEEVKALQVKSDAYDKLDGDDKTRHQQAPDPTNADDMAKIFAAMPHNQNADAVLK